MSTPVTRRAVTSGIAWSVPAVAATAAAPAFAVSSVTDDCMANIPANAGPFWPSNGAHTVSTTGGALINATTSYNYGINDRSSRGSVTLKFYDGISQTYVAQPYVTLNNGITYCGTATLDGTGTFVAPTGVSTSVSVQWAYSTKTNNSTLWNGVTAHIPFIYYWTSDAKLYSAQYEMLVTYPATGAFSAGVQASTVQFVKASYGCEPRRCSPLISSVTPNYPTAGSEVTIKGQKFLGVTSVSFGSAKITNFTVISDNEIKAIMPAAWPAGMVWGSLYDFVVCDTVSCSLPYARARG